MITVRTAAAALTALLAAGSLAACSGSGDSDSISVFDIKVGDCFTAPGDVQVELSTLGRVACDQDHVREAYALIDYSAVASGASTAGTAYPGADALSAFAKGACAQHYKDYVGVDYLDSSLYFTYLFPSARSWEQDDDRKIICFVTTTGVPLTDSVKDSKR